MKYLILLYISIVLVGCQGTELANVFIVSAADTKEPYIEPELVAYVSIFKVEAEKRNVDVSRIDDMRITFVPHLNSISQAAVCQYFNNGDRKILVSKIHWVTFSERRKEFLITHELGHCVLERPHLSVTEGRSFMNPNVPGEGSYYTNYMGEAGMEHLYNELLGE